MARLAESISENIEIVDQPEELAEEAQNFPWFIIPLVVVLAAIGAFFLIRRFTDQEN